MNKILCFCIFWLAPFLFSASPPRQVEQALAFVNSFHLYQHLSCISNSFELANQTRFCSCKKSALPGEANVQKQSLACLKLCHQSYCARARKAFAESERLAFQDFLRSRFEYEQGCYYLQRARCVLRQIESRYPQH